MTVHPARLLDTLQSCAEVRAGFDQSADRSVRSQADRAFISALVGYLEPEVLLMDAIHQQAFLSICQQLGVKCQLIPRRRRSH